MEKNRKAEEAVKNWLEQNGYDYEVRTCLPGEDAKECVKKEKDTISIPACGVGGCGWIYGAVREIWGKGKFWTNA